MRGVPAYLIGGLLTGTIPIMFVMGFVFGLFIGVTGRDMNAPEMRSMAAGLEVAGVLSILLTCLIASWFAREPDRQDSYALQPYSAAHPFQDPAINDLPTHNIDPQNPYAPPATDPLDRNR